MILQPVALAVLASTSFVYKYRNVWPENAHKLLVIVNNHTTEPNAQRSKYKCLGVKNFYVVSKALPRCCSCYFL